MKPEAKTRKLYVLDTSAFLTFLEDEPGAKQVQDLLEQAKQGLITLLTSFASFMEVWYITLQEEGEEEALRRVNLMKMLPLQRIESSEELGLQAGRIKANHKISFADAWIAATAMTHHAILVHKDPEFEALKDKIGQLRLPSKK